MSISGRSENECYDCGYRWRPRTRVISLRCPYCRSPNVGIVGIPESIPSAVYELEASPTKQKGPTILKKIWEVPLAVVGVAGGGILGVIWLVLVIVMPIGGVIFLWWLSYFFYEIGWWPLGAITRIAAWFVSAAMALFVLYVVGALLFGFWWLLTTPIRRPRALTIPLTVASGVALVLLVGPVFLGVFSSSEAGVSEVQRYFDEAKVLNPSTKAVEEWSKLNEGFYQTDLTRLTREQVVRMVQQQLAAAEKALVATTEALKAFRMIVPPEQCQEMHLLVTESLQLEQRGLIEIKQNLSMGLRGLQPDDDSLERANRLLNEADLTNQRALFVMDKCK